MLTHVIYPTARNIPAGAARYIQQNRTLNAIEFDILQPTNSLLQAPSINFCNGLFGVTVRTADGNSSTFQQMWNNGTCDFENGRANVSLNVSDFPDSAVLGESYTVDFIISIQVDGVVDLCYLYLEVDNVTVSQGELFSPVI